MKKKILILAIFVLVLFNFSTCFALTKAQVDVLFETYNNSSLIGSDGYNSLISDLESYSNVGVQVTSSRNIYFYLTSGKFYYSGGTRCTEDCIRYLFNSSTCSTGTVSSGKSIGLSSGAGNTYWYVENGVYSDDTFTSYTTAPGYESSELITNVTGTEEPDTPDVGEESGDTSGDFQATLPAIVQETQPEEVLAEIVGLLPIVMVCLVSWIGLRKALALLSELLKQS